jgi:TfoX/Sxy family transcriptional regulator of competence genes
MAYNESLAQRVRAALARIPRVEEKKMFGGLAFMVNEKMCINVGKDRLMCRIDPAMHENALKRKGCRTVIMKGREYKGYVYVNEEGLKTKEDFDYWIKLALDYNKQAKASTKKKK